MLKYPFNIENILVSATKTQKLNYALKSQEFDDTDYWGFANATLSTNTIPSPDGYISALELAVASPSSAQSSFTLTESSDTGLHGMFQLWDKRIQTVAGQTYTGSYYVRKGNGSKAPDIIQLLFGIDQYANFNISLGTVTKQSNCTAAITGEGNSWYRISITMTAEYTERNSVNLIFCNNDPDSDRLPSYAGTTDANIYIWGAQFEKGGLSSYKQADDTPGEKVYLTRQEVKDFIRVDYNTDDTIIDMLISGAYGAFEAFTSRSLREYQIEAVWEQFGASVDLPYAPVISVTTVNYRFEDGTNNDVTSVWEQVGDKIRVLKPEQVAYGNRLVVNYSTGYDVLPGNLKLGLLKWIASNYEDRQNTADFNVYEMPNGSKHLWAEYRVMSL